MHWPCWLRTWGGASSFTKTLISQSALCAFASARTHILLALSEKCRSFVTGTVAGIKTCADPVYVGIWYSYQWRNRLWGEVRGQSAPPPCFSPVNFCWPSGKQTATKNGEIWEEKKENCKREDGKSELQGKKYSNEKMTFPSPLLLKPLNVVIAVPNSKFLLGNITGKTF